MSDEKKLKVVGAWQQCSNGVDPTRTEACKASVTTTIRLRFDGRSTAHQRSLRSQRRNHSSRMTPTSLFTGAAVQQPDRNAGRREWPQCGPTAGVGPL